MRRSFPLLPTSGVLLLLLLFSPLLFPAKGATDAQATYIVHVAPSHKLAPSTFRHWYARTLRSLPGRPASSLLYDYSHAISGFSARLTPSQAAALRRLPSVLAVLPDRPCQRHTTRSPAFLRLSSSFGLWPFSSFASDVVVGILDTGVYPDSRSSFVDDSLPPPPSSWRGSCEAGKGFNTSFCNRKLIGARVFFKGYEAARGPIDETLESKSPLDTEGHGSHTASTAAGSAVDEAGFYQYARGEARGMATKARIAVYKICWKDGCYNSDILAAMDAAIADGVDVISLSVGASYPPAFYRDSIAIGAFGAMRHGVVVSCSAGNSGPGSRTAVNIAPWILTVGASTLDRQFPADVVLGDGSTYGGLSLYSGDPLDSTNLPLVYAGDSGSRLCLRGFLYPEKVAGKIVLCERGANARVEKGLAVKLAGGIGLILANDAGSGEELVADSHLVPATMVSHASGEQIKYYIKSQASPTATILFRGTVIGDSPAAPKVAAFSSRGPNYRAPEILKPDVIAPGVNILAAWTGSTSPTDLDIDPRRVEFNIISGTSMSCPHVSGIAALLRGAYPEWSPAAIKSALMTTAYNSDNAGEIIKDLATGAESTPFIRGAGHVDPNRALDPGLVYDLNTGDYLAFLCAIHYTPEQIAVFTNDEISVNCSDTALASPGGLNYPAFAVVFSSNSDVITYKRVVRNVGASAEAVYEANITSPPGVAVTVSPSKLEFDAVGQSLSYEIKIESLESAAEYGAQAFGSLAWSDGTHEVRSPIAVTWKQSFVSSI
ncbi:subtilisin-like protease SBT1.4 [Zingiber officinale]|uniref:subtilisin-like protease SBT1.4 n=1 Tax=Zingiber officinale TaxID=94328 RepID=UPI001C4AD51F|nr:subtilisin-like protease SBT1.4 [Zingiber officinale]